jgi:molybdopterin/thiamine biosynthesis adenylyltransferase
MEERLKHIVDCVTAITDLEIISPFQIVGDVIKGAIAVTEENQKLFFGVEISSQYPFQSHETETIRFINSDLLKYNHVNADGSICIHTHHSTELAQKIILDFSALKQWIVKYYINKDKDDHYEHIIVPLKAINGINRVFLFTDVDYNFTNGQFGFFKYSTISHGAMYNDKVTTNIVQEFIVNKQLVSCKWNNQYKAFSKGEGIYYFIENPPVENNRFALKSWLALEPFTNPGFLNFLYKTNTELPTGKNRPEEITLLIGYRINTTEIHWQAIRIDTNDFPNYGVKNPFTKQFEGKLHDKEINWVVTQNCSYKYFFGRGTMSEKLTESKILIVGVGAIGSIVATTLVRGGCKKINLVDYDIKEPENVCRAEYNFITGINNKVEDLSISLSSISPFVDVRHDKHLFDFAKFAYNNKNRNSELAEIINQYDVIFDCSTDNDVAFILSQLDIKSELFNLSTTNHAKELVCVINPNSYEWLMKIFQELNNDMTDLYNPTGCWSPTYKASYNDINTLVQYALKQINLTYENQLPMRNFYLSTAFDNGFTIKLNQF